MVEDGFFEKRFLAVCKVLEGEKVDRAAVHYDSHADQQVEKASYKTADEVDIWESESDFEGFARNFVTDNFPGWDDVSDEDDGCYGELVISVKDRRVTLNHYTRYTKVDVSRLTLTVKEAAEEPLTAQ